MLLSPGTNRDPMTGAQGLRQRTASIELNGDALGRLFSTPERGQHALFRCPACNRLHSLKAGAAPSPDRGAGETPLKS
jgi:hypothetical protein